MKRYISKVFLNSIFTDERPINNVQLITVVGKRNILTVVGNRNNLTHLYYNDGTGYCTSSECTKILRVLYSEIHR